MMRKNLRSLLHRLQFAAASVALLPALVVCAQTASASATPARPPVDDAGSAPAAAQTPNRAQAYYHEALAGIYEDDAINGGHPEEITRAIEEYKLALNADPESPDLNIALANLYFRIGRTHDAEATVRALLKIAPNNLDAHHLLGHIYLRQLGDASNSVSSTSPAGNVLDHAIDEYMKIVALKPDSVEDRMVLGQLYSVKHDEKDAETQFKAAQAIEPESEDVVLNLARLYAESGNIKQAVKVIEAIPVDDRTPKMEFTLGAAYDQLKQPKDAIAAYQRAADMNPGNEETMDALAQALMNNEQYDEALKQYKALLAADPENTEVMVHIGEIERHNGKYEDALAITSAALKKDPTSLEAGYNVGLLDDVLGRFDDAIQTYQSMVDQLSHANGAYTAEEKNNLGIFLQRLGSVYLEENKTDLAVATYQKMIDLGGDQALRGYQGQVDSYNQAKEFDKAIAVCRKAVAARPKDRDATLMLAGELADQGNADESMSLAHGLLKGNNDDRPIWLAIGQMNIRLRRWKDADDAFNTAATMTTKKEDRIYLLFLRGEWEERQHHDGPAERYFREALALDPTNAMTLNYLGYMMADKNTHLPEALTMIRKAVQLEPMNGAYLDSLGWVYFRLGEYELAEQNLRQAVNRDQTDPTVHEHLGDLYEKTGRIRQAAAQWELSLAQYAKSDPADIDQADISKIQKKLDSARIKLAKKENAAGDQPQP
jgi:tetratricopeptide (TPR) repeat protein